MNIEQLIQEKRTKESIDLFINDNLSLNTNYEPHKWLIFLGLRPTPQTIFGNEVTNMNLKEIANKYKTSELLELVKSEQYQDQYETIKYYPEDKIRKEIARQGYFPEEYLNDVSMDIRLVALEAHEEYVPKLMQTRKIRDTALLINYFKHHRNPNIEHLRAFIPRICHERIREAYALKIASSEHVTIIEQTMSRTKLYHMNNPKWAKGYTIQQIERVLEYVTSDEIEQERLDNIFFKVDHYYAKKRP